MAVNKPTGVQTAPVHRSVRSPGACHHNNTEPCRGSQTCTQRVTSHSNDAFGACARLFAQQRCEAVVDSFQILSLLPLISTRTHVTCLVRCCCLAPVMCRFRGGSMVNRAIHRLSGSGQSPHVLHRLDMHTSGVLLFAKTAQVVAAVSALLPWLITATHCHSVHVGM